MTNERMTISRPEDILGYIPHALGLWPEESLVALTLQGKTLGATLRADLPPDSRPSRLAAFAGKIGEYLAADSSADGALLVVYSGSGWEDGTAGERHRPLFRCLEEMLAAGGLVLRDAWLVGPGHWRGAFCEDPACCPWPGHPVEKIHDSRLNAEMVFRGSSVAPAVSADPPSAPYAGPADPGLEEEEAAALERFGELWRDRTSLGTMLDAWLRVLDRADGAPALGTASAAFLRASLRIPAWRDAVAVGAAAGRDTACAGAEAFGFFRGGIRRGLQLPDELACVPGAAEHADATEQTDAPAPERGSVSFQARGGNAAKTRARKDPAALLRYGDVLLGLHPAVPDWKRLDALERVLGELAARGGGEARAAALTLRGWIQWCRGSGSLADALLSQAEAEHPGYRLAALLMELVHRGTLCGWARNRAAAWRRFGGTAA
ncbi:DUF4192 domain-containing protein [Arthrobacter cupressi]|uniref:DUF4192 domain-containing protein n=1 Tax=Arthrobacter cupressi TaxID=1045773 RepID=A0A1G8M163_9MICC|nr:DUF4192 domain-containing protein [Arthrobacter cupressi]NYD79546.1 hypothetical protein [Arthrobacter cupressi]SDI61678.1 protein of unknown function [Arthrobacter cupressi]